MKAKYFDGNKLIEEKEIETPENFRDLVMQIELFFNREPVLLVKQYPKHTEYAFQIGDLISNHFTSAKPYVEWSKRQEKEINNERRL